MRLAQQGEEVYSIAIALLEAAVPEKRFNIVGVDINTEALESAKSGIYNERNISKLPVQLLRKYFSKTGCFILKFFMEFSG